MRIRYSTKWCARHFKKINCLVGLYKISITALGCHIIVLYAPLIDHTMRNNTAHKLHSTCKNSYRCIPWHIQCHSGGWCDGEGEKKLRVKKGSWGSGPKLPTDIYIRGRHPIKKKNQYWKTLKTTIRGVEIKSWPRACIQTKDMVPASPNLCTPLAVHVINFV